MVGLIKRKIEKSWFAKLWLSLLVFLLVSFTARLAFSSQESSTLRDVLLNTPPRHNPFDPAMIVMILLAFSVTTLSLAKGYEILRRANFPKLILPGGKSLPLDNNGDKELMDELKTSLDETRRSKENMLKDNDDLRSKRKILHLELEELKQVEHMLRKSNLSLDKECERLKTENEALTLKASSLPVAAKKSEKKKISTKGKPISKRTKK